MNPLMLLATALLLPGTALAHPGGALSHGLLAGFSHPFSGADHLLAMVAVGLWAGLSGGAARLALPGGFLGGMALGALLGLSGVVLPMAEAGILASVIILGALAALAVRPPLVLGVALAAGFGLLHGHAHGTELPGGLAMLGMIGGTAVLHAAGLALAQPMRQAARVAGAATAVAGLALAFV